MRPFLPALIFTLLTAGLAAQGSSQTARILIDTTGTVHPWTHLEVNNDADNFQFAILADHSGGHRPGVFPDAIKKLNLLQPEFVISVGDLIEGYTTDREQIFLEWKEIHGFIDSLEMPFFYVPGNHDYLDRLTAGIWEELYGRSFYHFVYKNVLFLCLNTEEALQGTDIGGIGKPQYEYIRKVLADNPDVMWTLVFMHRPLWLCENTPYWEEAEALLAERRHTVFAGHQHQYIACQRNNGMYYVLATTGGISQMRGPDYGEFDHIVLVTMTEEGPVIANLMLQGILDDRVVTGDLQKLMASQPVMIDPVFTPDWKFRDDIIKVWINNDKNYPMWTALKFDMHALVVPEIIELQKLIPPGSTEEVDIPFYVTRPANVSNAKPIKLYAKFLFKMENNRDIEISSDYGILPVKPEYCTFSEQEVQVDGDLSEWTGFPFRGNSQSFITGDRNSYTGDFDGSYEFAVTCDEEYLYVALSVWDDELITNDNWSFQSQDAVWLFLDARPTRESANNRGKNSLTDHLFLEFSLPPSRKGEPVLSRRESLPEKLRVSGRKTIQGADFEISIPVDYLDEMNGHEWKGFRLNLAYCDKDNNNPLTIIWWRPDWGSTENYIGSGLFFRNTSDQDR